MTMSLSPDTMMGLLSFAVILLVLVSGRLADRVAVMEERIECLHPDCDCEACRGREDSMRATDD